MTSVGGLGMGLFQKTFMARMPGWMDEGKWSRWISLAPHNIYLKNGPDRFPSQHISCFTLLPKCDSGQANCKKVEHNVNPISDWIEWDI